MEYCIREYAEARDALRGSDWSDFDINRRLECAEDAAMDLLYKYSPLFAASEETAAQLSRVQQENARLRGVIEEAVFDATEGTDLVEQSRVAAEIVARLRAALTQPVQGGEE